MQPQKNQATLTSLLQQLKEEISFKINCTRVGSIKSFDPITQRAEVQMVDNIEILNQAGEFEAIKPDIFRDVPVQINATFQGGLTVPINVNDFCIIQFNDRDLTNWKETGKTEELPLASLRSHSFSDGIAVIGVFPNTTPLANYNNNATEVFYGNTKFSLDGKAGLSNANGDLKTSIDNLIDKINGLINVIVALQVEDLKNKQIAELVPATTTALNACISDFNAVKTEFGNLLK